MEENVGIAYIDEKGQMHIISKTKESDLDFAKERAKNGKILEVDIPYKFGNPFINNKQIIVCGINECYEDGNKGGDDKHNTETKYPELAALYKTLSE